LTKVCGRNPSTEARDIIAINAAENGTLTEDPAMVNRVEESRESVVVGFSK
jgi:hypothetical protein